MVKKLLGLSVFLAVAGQASAQNVRDDVDRFTGKRNITYTSQGKVQLGVPILSIAVETSPGRTLSSVQFMASPKLEGRHQSMKYLRCHSVDWLVDGAPVPLGETAYDMQHYKGTMVEFVRQPIDAAQMAQFGRASRIEYRICGDEFELSPVDIAAFREVAAKMSPGTLPAASPASPATAAPAAPSGMKWKPRL